MVPYSISKLGAAAGVMITASHNPKNDNGLKLYASNGCQIIPPTDVGVAQAISENLEPVIWNWGP
jgi:phosphoglucomutase